MVYRKVSNLESHESPSRPQKKNQDRFSKWNPIGVPMGFVNPDWRQANWPRKVVPSEWLSGSRNLDWEFSYVSPEKVFPHEMAGNFTNSMAAPDETQKYQSSAFTYIKSQFEKEMSIRAVRDAIGRADDFENLNPQWSNTLKLQLALMPQAEFSTMIGALRNVRFGHNSSWRQSASLLAIDELRHSQLSKSVFQEIRGLDPQFAWIENFYYVQNWLSVAFRHLIDEILLTSNVVEYAIAVHLIFENGFYNFQLMGLSALAKKVGDKLFEKMLLTIQSDETRHAQAGIAVIEKACRENPEYVQKIFDKYFWRTWPHFALSTGFAMDYLSPIDKRGPSFKEFMEDLVIPRFLENMQRFNLKKPWYWETFIESIDYYHHMLYSAAYGYRSTLWFDLALPTEKERQWLHRKYPKSWEDFESIWKNYDLRWKQNHITEFDVHAVAVPGFCNTCQMPLCGGAPKKNAAVNIEFQNQNYIFCSEPCRWLFTQQPEIYSGHKNLNQKIMEGEVPANLFGLLKYFGLDLKTCGKDLDRKLQGDQK